MDGNRPDVVIFIGPQGSGKGTQAQILKGKINAEYVEMGSLLRAVAKQDTDLGREVKAHVETGELVSDSIWQRVIEEKLKALGPETPAIFDGSPRTLDQANMLLEMLRVMGKHSVHTVHVSITREEAMQRLLHRAKCADCNTAAIVENVENQRCPVCGGVLEKRSDDTPEVINKRLDNYERTTLPVVDFLARGTTLHHIDGMHHVDEVAASIDAALGIDGSTPDEDTHE